MRRPTLRQTLTIGCWTALAALFVLPSTVMAAEEAPSSPGGRAFAFQTAYLHQELEGAHRITVSGSLGPGGSGFGIFVLDPNTCTVNPFGDREICTLIAPKTFFATLHLLKIADTTGAGRGVYAVSPIGFTLTNELYLVYSWSSSAPARLVSHNRGGVQRVVTLEPLSAPGWLAQNASAASGPAPAGPVLGIGEYHAWQVPGAVIVVAEGTSPESGHKIYLQQLPLTVFPPEFALLDVPPSGISLPVLTPFRVATGFAASQPVSHVFVRDRTGRHTVPVQQVSFGEKTLNTPQPEPAIAPATAPEKNSQATSALPIIVTGVSQKLSYDEAMSDAVRQLKPPHPDALFHCSVITVLVESGGKTGKRELRIVLGATAE